MRIGCSTITFGPQPVAEALQRIADLGFSVVDLAAAPSYFEHIRLVDPPAGQAEVVAGLVQAHGLEVAGFISVPWVPDAIDDAEELRRRYVVAADAALAVGASAWIVDANVPASDDSHGRAVSLARFKRTITMAAELAAARGLRLGIEAPHSGTLAASLPEVIELLDAAGLPDLGIGLDTCHIFNSGASTADMLSAIGGRVVHVALRDAHADGRSCTPGDGAFDFDEFFQLLRQVGYTGDATLELEPPNPNASADERASEARRGRDYVERLLTANYSTPAEQPLPGGKP
ncbi:sugar phosphate isomerase/epimerase family protein [Jiangella gansuensis]|uniref:sugar phosphate isomerase/epimerase family protein n=1 Tax=Jiangella gansuensis TaxID=281473 RepID=UPI0004AD9FDC|nr:sugar phosphate isomerase/epimerase [Jiangella gansuensis]